MAQLPSTCRSSTDEAGRGRASMGRSAGTCRTFVRSCTECLLRECRPGIGNAHSKSRLRLRDVPMRHFALRLLRHRHKRRLTSARKPSVLCNELVVFAWWLAMHRAFHPYHGRLPRVRGTICVIRPVSRVDDRNAHGYRSELGTYSWTVLDAEHETVKSARDCTRARGASATVVLAESANSASNHQGSFRPLKKRVLRTLSSSTYNAA